MSSWSSSSVSTSESELSETGCLAALRLDVGIRAEREGGEWMTHCRF